MSLRASGLPPIEVWRLIARAPEEIESYETCVFGYKGYLIYSPIGYITIGPKEELFLTEFEGDEKLVLVYLNYVIPGSPDSNVRLKVRMGSDVWYVTGRGYTSSPMGLFVYGPNLLCCNLITDKLIDKSSRGEEVREDDVHVCERGEEFTIVNEGDTSVSLIGTIILLKKRTPVTGYIFITTAKSTVAIAHPIVNNTTNDILGAIGEATLYKSNILFGTESLVYYGNVWLQGDGRVVYSIADRGMTAQQYINVSGPTYSYSGLSTIAMPEYPVVKAYTCYTSDNLVIPWTLAWFAIVYNTTARSVLEPLVTRSKFTVNVPEFKVPANNSISLIVPGQKLRVISPQPITVKRQPCAFDVTVVSAGEAGGVVSIPYGTESELIGSIPAELWGQEDSFYQILQLESKVDTYVKVYSYGEL